MKLSAKRLLAQLLLVAVGATLLAVAPLPSVTLVPELGVDRAALALEAAPLPDEPVLDNPYAHDEGEGEDAHADEPPATEIETHPPTDAHDEGTTGDRLQGGATDVPDFVTVGLTFDEAPSAPPLVRVHSNGSWGAWMELQIEPDEAPDRQTGEGGGGVSTSPLWVRAADGYEVNLADEPAADTAEVLLVRETGQTVKVEDATPPAGSSDGRPPIYSRSTWGARPFNGSPSYGRVRVGIVHHSVTANSYGPGDVPAILRSIQAFHMDGNGWSDIGYNFAVDRYGTTWEARAGGVHNASIGGHAMGFNSNSTGVVILGDFSSTAPTSSSLTATGELLGWKLGLHGVVPGQVTNVTSLGSSSIPAGQVVSLNTVSGHRNVGATGCPGNEAYNRLSSIRNVALAKYQNLPGLLGSLDVVQGRPGGVRVAGWAIDPYHPTGNASAHVYVDGVGRANVPAASLRTDVGRVYPYGNRHGFDTTIPIASGTHEVCVYAVGDQRPIVHGLGCRRITIPSDPFGSVDGISMGFDRVRVQGWATDPNTSNPIDIHVYVDGRGAGAFTADASRTDIPLTYPGLGPNHGFDEQVAVAPGTHDVCVFAINEGPGTSTLMQCRRVTSPSGSPFGSLDVATASGGGIRVAGWAIDPDTPAPIEMHVYIDGVGTSGIMANQSRTDVAAVHPLYGPNHGFDALLPASAGGHDVCVFAINQGIGSNVLMQCRRVVV